MKFADADDVTCGDVINSRPNKKLV